MTTIADPTPSTTRRVVLIATAVVVVLALTAAALLAGRSLAGAGGPGPVRAAFTQLTYTTTANEDVGFASIELRNTGDREAVIESVTPVGVPLGLDVRDVLAADTRTLNDPIGARAAYTLPDLRPAAGTALPPRAASSTQLVFVVAGTRPGRFTFRTTTIRYRVGEDTHTLKVPAGATLVAERGEG